VSSCKQLKAVKSSWKQLQLAKCSNEQALNYANNNYAPHVCVSFGGLDLISLFLLIHFA